jgi:hypothetical protein
MRRLEPLCCAFAGYTGFSWFVKPTHWCGRFTWAQLVSVVKPVIAEWVRWAGLRVEWLRTSSPHGDLSSLPTADSDVAPPTPPPEVVVPAEEHIPRPSIPHRRTLRRAKTITRGRSRSASNFTAAEWNVARSSGAAAAVTVGAGKGGDLLHEGIHARGHKWTGARQQRERAPDPPRATCGDRRRGRRGAARP